MVRLLAFVMLAACHGSPSGGGDLGGISVVPMQYDPVAMTQAALGPQLDLVRPPQGGYVVFVGARVSGFDRATTVELTGNLRDGSGTVVSTDARTVTLMPALDDASVLIPDLRSITTVANIAVCPSTSTTDRVNAAFTVEVQVADRATGRAGSGTQMTQLVCRQSDMTVQKNCTCECMANFMVGKCP